MPELRRGRFPTRITAQRKSLPVLQSYIDPAPGPRTQDPGSWSKGLSAASLVTRGIITRLLLLLHLLLLHTRRENQRKRKKRQLGSRTFRRFSSFLSPRVCGSVIERERKRGLSASKVLVLDDRSFLPFSCGQKRINFCQNADGYS